MKKRLYWIVFFFWVVLMVVPGLNICIFWASFISFNLLPGVCVCVCIGMFADIGDESNDCFDIYIFRFFFYMCVTQCVWLFDRSESTGTNNGFVIYIILYRIYNTCVFVWLKKNPHSIQSDAEGRLSIQNTHIHTPVMWPLWKGNSTKGKQHRQYRLLSFDQKRVTADCGGKRAHTHTASFPP